jgi:hypothetical protein
VERDSDPKEGEDGQDPAVVGGGGGEAELGEDAGDVLLDRTLGDDQAVGDGSVAAALGQQGQDVELAGAEGAQGVGLAAAAEELGATTSGSMAAPPSPTRRTAVRNSPTSATRSLSR